MDRPVNFSQPSLKKVHFLSGPDIQISTVTVSATSRKRCSLSRSTPSDPFSSVLLARNARVLCFLFNEFENILSIIRAALQGPRQPLSLHSFASIKIERHSRR